MTVVETASPTPYFCGSALGGGDMPQSVARGRCLVRFLEPSHLDPTPTDHLPMSLTVCRWIIHVMLGREVPGEVAADRAHSTECAIDKWASLERPS